MEITPGSRDMHFSFVFFFFKAMGQCQGFSAFWKEVKDAHCPLTYWDHQAHTPSHGLSTSLCRNYQTFCCILQNNLCLWCMRVRHMARWWHSKEKMKESVSHSVIYLFATPWTVAYQVPPSMGFSSQECWSGLPCPIPGDLPDPGMEVVSPALAWGLFTNWPPGKP